MKKIKFLVLISLIIISCEKDKIEGPNLNDLFGELTIMESLDVIGDSTDFTLDDYIYFTASFSKQVNWKLTIQGLNTGSIKIINGTSNEINQSNSRWDGSSSLLPFFINEDCRVQLTFENHFDTLVNYLNIQKPKDYISENTVLITDFEAGFNPNFTGFFQAGCTKSLASVGSGEGLNYLQQYGTCDWDWLIGYIDYKQEFWLNENTLVNNPSQVFFNIMIKGDSTISQVAGVPNSVFKIEFYEDENGDGYYDANTEDRYDYEFDVNWNGWRMVSFRYNDEKLVLANSGGDGISNPSKVSNIRTLLLANPESGFAKADVDFLIWSIGYPILN